jgi:hypothetical protein
MTTQVTKKKIDLGFLIQLTVTISAIVLIIYGSWWIGDENKKQRNEFKQVACPSLLSIGRSARDTLIIMKVEPLCNTYVLDNLK